MALLLLLSDKNFIQILRLGGNLHISAGCLRHARVVVNRGDLGDGLAAGLGRKGNELLEHEVARVLAKLVDVGGGETGGFDGVEDYEMRKERSVSEFNG